MKKLLAILTCLGGTLGCQSTPCAEQPLVSSPLNETGSVATPALTPESRPAQQKRYVSVAATTRVVKEIVLAGHDEAITAVGMTYRQVITASREGLVRMWKLDNNIPIYKSSSPGIGAIVFHPGRRREKDLVALGGDRVSLWRVSGFGDVTSTSELKVQGSKALSLSENGERLLIHGDDGKVSVWNTKTGEQISELKGTFRNAAVLNPKGTVVGTSDEGVRLWSAATGHEHASSSDNNLGTIEFSPDGKSILVAGSRVLLLDATDLRLKREFVSGSEECRAAHLSGDGSVVLALCGNYDGRANHIRVFDEKTGKLISKIEDIVDTAELNEDGSTLLTLSKGSRLAKLWNPANGHLLAEFKHDFGVQMAQFAGWPYGGIRVVTGDRRGIVKLWEVELGIL